MLSHPDLALHDPPGGHPESPARLAAALAGVRASGVGLDEREAREATRGELERVHPSGYLDALEEVSDPGGWLDPDTWIGPASLRAARPRGGRGLRGRRGGALRSGGRRVLCGAAAGPSRERDATRWASA